MAYNYIELASRKQINIIIVHVEIAMPYEPLENEPRLERRLAARLA